MSTQQEFDQLNGVFEEFGVSVAYIFGSVASGKASKLSDLDIAVLFSDAVAKEDYFNTCLRISARIRGIVDVAKVDVVELNSDHSPLLRFNAVFKGKLIFIRDTQAQFHLEKIIRQQYEDTQSLRNRQFAIAKSKLAGNATHGALQGSPYLQNILSQ